MISAFQNLSKFENRMYFGKVGNPSDELCKNNPFYFPAKNEENDIFSSFGANYQVSVSC